MSDAMKSALETVQKFLFARKHAYRRVFSTPPSQIVLMDLARFCRANESTSHPDQRMSDILAGRREVWLRIQQHLKLTDAQLWELYGRTGLEDLNDK